MYYKTTVKNHVDFKFSESGLVINPKWPYVGASPDWVISCHCCGKGLLEIECPYNHQNTDILDANSQDNKFCLKKVDGSLRLDNSHVYYHQIQTQLFVTLNIVIFLYAHLWKMMKLKAFILNVFIRMKHFGRSVFQKLNNSLKLACFLRSLENITQQPNSSLTQVTDSTQLCSNNTAESRCDDT